MSTSSRVPEGAAAAGPEKSTHARPKSNSSLSKGSPIEIKSQNTGRATGSQVIPASRGPPLSERDSIFAENYHHEHYEGEDDSKDAVNKEEAAQPVCGKEPPNMAATVMRPRDPQQLDSKKESSRSGQREPFDIYLLGNNLWDSRFNSLVSGQMTPASDSPTQPYAQSKTLSDHILALPPFSPTNSPRERPSTPRTQTLTTSSTQSDETSEERVRYRSWREGLPVLGGRVMGCMDGEILDAPVDKRIEATLPRSDQSAIARSRKTSHMLGIFKEQDTGSEQKKDEKIRKEKLSEVLAIENKNKSKPVSTDQRHRKTFLNCCMDALLPWSINANFPIAQLSKRSMNHRFHLLPN